MAHLVVFPGRFSFKGDRHCEGEDLTLASAGGRGAQAAAPGAAAAKVAAAAAAAAAAVSHAATQSADAAEEGTHNAYSPG